MEEIKDPWPNVEFVKNNVNIECDKCNIQTAEEKKNISELKKK